MLKIILIREMQIKAIKTYHFIPIRKLSNTKCWVNVNPHSLLWKVILVRPWWKTVLNYLTKYKIFITCSWSHILARFSQRYVNRCSVKDVYGDGENKWVECSGSSSWGNWKQHIGGKSRNINNFRNVLIPFFKNF